MIIKRHHIKQHSPEWFQYRLNGYGASECAGVMSEYNDELNTMIHSSAKEIHLGKIGEKVTRFSGNPNSEAGHMMEPIIVEMYRYWDHFNPNIMVMHENRKKGIKLNTVRLSKFFMTNSMFPWLFFSPDGIEYDKTFNPETDKCKLIAKGLIECKNTTSMEANRYPNGFSPSFLVQVAQGLLISQLEYARILLFVDGYDLRVITVYADSPEIKQIQENILECTYRSWQNVLECREIKSHYNIHNYYGYNPDRMTAGQQEGVGMLQAREPEFSGSEKEWEWIRNNVIKTEDYSSMEVTTEQTLWLKNRAALKEQEGKIQSDIRKVESNLVQSLGEYHEAIMGIESDRPMKAFSYKPTQSGNNKFYVNPKYINYDV